MVKFLLSKDSRMIRLVIKPIACILLLCLCILPFNKSAGSANAQTLFMKKNAGNSLFKNPIMDNGADPWVIYNKGYYYMTMTTGDDVTIWKSKSLTNIASGEKKVVWTPSGANYRDIWAPELHFINGRWYIYFAADQNGNNATHRMYVLESKSADPFGSYSFMGEIKSPDDNWAIDGTVLNVNSKLYFIWSGWRDPSDQRTQSLYIAQMSSPVQISSQRVLISTPSYPWETSAAPINEGPEVLQYNDKTFLVFSANGSWTDNYCLGMLELKGTDPLNSEGWVKNPAPVFKSDNNVYGPGHSSFTASEDGTQNWIVYHAARFKGAGWDRNIRTQPFTWNRDGSPNFGQPLPQDATLALPSGEKPYSWTTAPSSSSTNDTLFTINAEKEGYYSLRVRYQNRTVGGNGSFVNVLGNVSVNGREQNTVSYPSTGGSNQWSTLSEKVYLKHGQNIIRFAHSNSAVAIQYIEVPFNKEVKNDELKNIYQAEDNIYYDAWTGREYNASNGEVVGHIDHPDSYVKFNNIQVPHSGDYMITVRYDNGMSDCTDLVSVNNGTPFNLLLPSTGAWNNFKSVTFKTHLNAGLNSIQITHGSYYAEIDYIQVSQVKE